MFISTICRKQLNQILAHHCKFCLMCVHVQKPLPRYAKVANAYKSTGHMSYGMCTWSGLKCIRKWLNWLCRLCPEHFNAVAFENLPST